jgi:hypothetical protein
LGPNAQESAAGVTGWCNTTEASFGLCCHFNGLQGKWLRR